MKKSQNNSSNSSSNNSKNKAKNGTNTNGFLPNSLKFISSCIKTVSSNVRSAGASVADDHRKDQVLWACFDRLEVDLSSFKRVLLIGYTDGFQVLDVEDATSVCELVSRRDDPVTFLQMQPIPAKSDGREGYKKSHPLLLVVASEEITDAAPAQTGRDGFIEPRGGSIIHSPTAVRFYSLRSHNYVHVLRFRSTVYMVRCSSKVVAVGLAAQIYCFDALTLENKFSVLTYPVPQLGGQGVTGVNIGYGPMAVGPRWLAYASNNPMLSNTGRLSPQSLSPSPGVSPSTSPGNGNLVARYAMESSKHLAAGLINLGDMGYKTLSKYCHELLPDGSNSPVSTSASWKLGRIPAHSTETDAAGMVVIKDFVSRAVISQFRAHTSPISALCFDPSGTLLVTASTRGNNINIFRIIPSCSPNGAGNQSSDWKASHVHLYKLHRGVTPAVIQDICFSHYSQWVAIISSRGTCHLFVLSPFGGETGLQLQNSHVDGPILLPILSGPWWSRSTFMVNQQSYSPAPAPTPITLSVVNRIKSSGWLNTVSNAASSAAGKVSVPSGVLAAVFHSSVHREQPALQKFKALEHLLAYTPCGHLIQYELMPSFGGEQGDSYVRTGTGSVVQMQEDDAGVKVDPIQWWDVCRRADWPEREECIHGITIGGREATDTVMGDSLSENDDMGGKDSTKLCDRSHWYLSNAEVQLKSGRIPVWQKSKIYFCTMSFSGYEEQNTSRSISAGEIEIEKIPVNEVDIRRKDLLPVFDHFHRIPLKWSDDSSSLDKEKSGNATTSIARGDSLSVKSFTPVPGLHKMGTGPISYPRVELSAEEKSGLRSSSYMLLAPEASNNGNAALGSSTNILCSVEESYALSSPSPSKSESFSPGGTSAREVQSSNSTITSEASNSSSSRSDMSMNVIDEQPVHEDMSDTLDFGQIFQEGYCKASTNDESHGVTGLVADMDSSSPCDKEKSEDDGESDDMLGGVFAFSEEG